MLSIVLPSYKGADILKNQLPAFITFLKDENIDHEIIIVDDGSGDDGETERIALETGCRFLPLDNNVGKGAAVRKGVFLAKGDYIIFTDVDIPFNYESFRQFLHYLDMKEFDIVIGDRTLPGSSYFTKISGSRKLGSDIYSFIVGRFITGGLFDTQCGMKGFRRNVAIDLFSSGRIHGFAFDVELLYIALKRNYDIKRLPVILRSNEGSSVSLLRHGTRMVLDLFRIIWFQKTGAYRQQCVNMTE